MFSIPYTVEFTIQINSTLLASTLSCMHYVQNTVFYLGNEEDSVLVLGRGGDNTNAYIWSAWNDSSGSEA